MRGYAAICAGLGHEEEGRGLMGAARAASDGTELMLHRPRSRRCVAE